MALSNSPLTLYFSLPFYPVRGKTYFYHGHLALGIEDLVYQIYNPYLLKSGFLVSVMPRNTWLHESGRFWVDRDRTSPTYRHVHLYKESELAKTSVYFIGVVPVDTKILPRIEKYFTTIEELFQNGRLKFNFFSKNCAGFLNEVYYDNFGISRGCFDVVPSLFFHRIGSFLKAMNSTVTIGKLRKSENGKFRIHRYCIGINSLSCEMSMDNWVAAQQGSLCGGLRG